jgi:hypothetical protein
MAICHKASLATNKNKQSRKGKMRSRQSASSANAGGVAPGASNTKLVPWNREVRLTDQLRLPIFSETQTVFTRKSDATLAAIAQSSSVGSTLQINFTFANSVNDSSYAAVFDQYRIVAAEVIPTPRITEANQVSPYPAGYLYTVLDYDDATALTSPSAAQDYSSCIITPVTEAVRRCVKPRIAMAAYSGAFTSFANVADQWIDAASTGVIHYGIKCIMDVGTASALVTYDLEQVVVVQFRSQR